jgi:hypothetical protein
MALVKRARNAVAISIYRIMINLYLFFFWRKNQVLFEVLSVMVKTPLGKVAE